MLRGGWTSRIVRMMVFSLDKLVDAARWRFLLVVGVALPGCTLLFSEAVKPSAITWVGDSAAPVPGGDAASTPSDATGVPVTPDAEILWGSRPGIAFVTFATVRGNLGGGGVAGAALAAANHICDKAAKQVPQLKSRFFKAYIAVHDAGPGDQPGAEARVPSAGISSNSMGWENTGGQQISAKASLWAQTFSELGSFGLEPLLLTESASKLGNERELDPSSFPGPKIWVGTLNGTTTVLNDCNGWSVGDSSRTGIFVTTSFGGNAAKGQGCEQDAHLLCIEVPQPPQ